MGYRYYGEVFIPEEYRQLYEAGMETMFRISRLKDKWFPTANDYDMIVENKGYVVYSWSGWKRHNPYWENYMTAFFDWIADPDTRENNIEGFAVNPWTDYEDPYLSEIAVAEWSAWACNQATDFVMWNYPAKYCGFYAIGEELGDVDIIDEGIGLSYVREIEGSPAGDDLQNIIGFGFETDDKEQEKLYQKALKEAKVFPFVDLDEWNDTNWIVVGKTGKDYYRRWTTEESKFLDDYSDYQKMHFYYDGDEAGGSDYWDWEIYVSDRVVVDYYQD